MGRNRAVDGAGGGANRPVMGTGFFAGGGYGYCADPEFAVAAVENCSFANIIEDRVWRVGSRGNTFTLRE